MTDAEITLEPCPSCEAQNVFLTHTAQNKDARRHVECRICQMRGPVKCSEVEAVSAWNALRRSTLLREGQGEVEVKPLMWRTAHSRLRKGVGLLPGMEYVLDGELVGVPWRLKFGDRVFGVHVGDFNNRGAAEAAAQDHYAATIRSALSPSPAVRDGVVEGIVNWVCDDVLPAYGIASEVGRNDVELFDSAREALARAALAPATPDAL